MPANTMEYDLRLMTDGRGVALPELEGDDVGVGVGDDVRVAVSVATDDSVADGAAVSDRKAEGEFDKLRMPFEADATTVTENDGAFVSLGRVGDAKGESEYDAVPASACVPELVGNRLYDATEAVTDAVGVKARPVAVRHCEATSVVVRVPVAAPLAERVPDGDADAMTLDENCDGVKESDTLASAVTERETLPVDDADTEEETEGLGDRDGV